MNARAPLSALLVLFLLPLVLHSRLIRGEALLAWDCVAQAPPWRAPEGAARPWNPLPLDPLLQQYPQGVLARDGPRSWNPYLLLGEPVTAFTAGPALESPPVALLHALFPPWLALGLGTLVHLVAAGWIGFAWLRWRGLGARAALAGAIGWELSPLVTSWLAVQLAYHLPWALLTMWAAEALGRTGTRRAGVLLACAVGGAAQVGHPLILFYAFLAALALGSIALLRARPERARALTTLAAFALAFALGLGLAASRQLPGVLAFLDGHRAPAPSWEAQLATTGALSPRHLSLLIAPDLLGSPLRWFNLLGLPGQRYANYQEMRLYVGLVGLVLAAAGARRGAGAPALLALAALGLTFPALARLVAATPLGATSPTRWLIAAHLLAPLAVGHGFQALARGDPLPRRVALVVLGLTGLLAVGTGFAPLARWLLPPLAPDLMGIAAHRAADLLPAWAEPTAVAAGERRALLLSPTLGPLLLATCANAAIWLSAQPRRRRAGLALLAGLLAHDLLREAQVYTPAWPAAALFPDTPGTALARTRAGSERVLLDEGLLENSLLPLGIRTVGGYQGVHSRRLDALLGAVDAKPGRQRVSPHGLPPPWRDALSTRVVLTAPGAAPTRPEGLSRLQAGPDCGVWEAPGALPRARLHPLDAVWSRSDAAAALELVRAPWFDPRRHVVVEEPGPPRDGATAAALPAPLGIEVDRPERVVVRVDAPEGGVLLLADAWGSGWTARLTGGETAATLPAQVVLRAVRIPPGFAGRVELYHVLPGRLAGRLVSGAALLLLAGIVLAPRSRLRPAP